MFVVVGCKRPMSLVTRNLTKEGPSRRTFFSSGSSSSNSNSNRHHSKAKQENKKWSFFQGTKNRPFATLPPNRDPGLAITSVISDPKEVPAPRGLPSRAEQLRRLENQASRTDSDDSFDVLVVGGGATGAGVALDAATRGLNVACIERGDFSSETSSRSTKLIWAGIKYMATATSILLSPKLITNPISTVTDFVGEMNMVFNCHQERRYMMQKQEHLCNWIPIAIPFDRWHVSPPPFDHWLYGFFPVLAPFVLKFYDALSFFQCPPSFIMTSNKAKSTFPTLNEKDIKYCAVFYEAQHNDARTNIAIALSAAEHGAAIANYVEMIQTITDHTGKVIGVHALDRMTGRTFPIKAKRVVFAGGPFTDRLREMEVLGSDNQMQPAVRGAHGTHIVLPGYYCSHEMGLLDYNTSDGRFLFILPWEGHTLIGTTDRMGPAETSPRAPEEDIEWLLKESAKYLTPDLKFRRTDVLSAWRGWRPLAADPHAAPDAPASRDHVISENPTTGIIFIAGGKWTTWREMAEEVTDRVVAGKGTHCKTLDIKLFGGEGYTKTLPIQLIQKYGMSESVAQHLAKTYGTRAWEVCELAEATPNGEGKQRLLENYPYIVADVIWACREYACTIEDVVSRRTRLAFLNRNAAMEVIPMVADIMAKELGWTKKVKNEQIAAAEKYVDSYNGQLPEASTRSQEIAA